MMVPIQLETDTRLFARISQSASNFIGVFEDDYWLALALVLIAMLTFLKLTHHLYKSAAIDVVPTVWTWMQHYNMQDTLVVRSPTFVTATFLISTSLLSLFTMRFVVKCG